MLLCIVTFTGRNCCCHTFLHKEHWLKATFLKPTKNLMLFLVYVYRDKSLGPPLILTFKLCTALDTCVQTIRLIHTQYAQYFNGMFNYKYLHDII